MFSRALSAGIRIFSKTESFFLRSFKKVSIHTYLIQITHGTVLKKSSVFWCPKSPFSCGQKAKTG